MKASRGDSEHTLAVFIDFENLALGFHGRRDRFQIEKVLERLVEKGKIVVKKAYSDWSRFGQYTGPLHEAAIELIEIPKRSLTGKNSADIRLVVDAIDLAYSKDHIDTFVIVSGDSDFSPLVSKLKELGKHVIGLGLANATSDLLRDNCDEFIYYEDLGRAPVTPLVANDTQMPEQKQKLYNLLMDSLLALRRENKELIFSSMVKDTMKRKKPSFNEEYYGFRTFSELLEDAEKQGFLDLEKHRSSGTYVVTRFGQEPKGMAPPALNAAPPAMANGPGNEAPLRNEPPRDRGGRGNGRRVEPQKPREAVVPPPVPVAVPPAATVNAPRRGRAPERDRTPEVMPLGRDLINEIDDDLDTVPSYLPQKPKASAAAKPAVPAGRGPGRSTPPAKPAQQPKQVPTIKPKAEPVVKRAAEPKKPKPAEEPRRKPPSQSPPPTRKPAPAADADDSFGAGLDL